MRSVCKVLLLMVCMFLPTRSTEAQWVNQTIPLKQGWNAVFLEVEPYPQECSLIFANLPVKSVWYYDQRFSPVQFIQDPSELVPEDPEWRVFFPASQPESFSTNLFILEAGRSYLIEAKEAFTWTFVGKPKLTVQQWNPNSYNLVGFHVDPQNPPTFSTWFAPSAAHNPVEVWTLDTNQRWVAIQNPSASQIEPCKAYWVKCNGVSEYQGPVRVKLTEGYELNFERDLVEHDIEVQRLGAGAGNVIVEVAASLPPPAVNPQSNQENPLPLAGIVPIQYFGRKVEGNQELLAYVNFPVAIPYSADETLPKRLQLAVDRMAMTPPPTTGESLYQSIMVFRNGNGYLRKVGVVSLGLAPTAAPGKLRTLQADQAPIKSGLWVGTVSLNRVQEPHLDIMTETPAVFDFRIILHVDEQGKVRLLNEVTQLWRDGTYKPDPVPGNPNAKSVDQPGRFILMTPSAPPALQEELRIGQTVRPASLRDGRPFARRISTAMFSLMDENRKPEDPLMDLTGGFGQPGSQVSIVLVLEDTDPMNPFHHQYHPFHAYPKPGDVPVASNDWTIMREISLEFAAAPPGGSPPAGWGDTQLGGVYREVLTGLKRAPFQVEGTFELLLVSNVPVLNDGLTQ